MRRHSIILLTLPLLLSCGGTTSSSSASTSQQESESSVSSSSSSSTTSASSKTSTETSSTSSEYSTSAEPSSSSSEDLTSTESSTISSTESEEPSSSGSSSEEDGPVLGLFFDKQEYDLSIGKTLYLTVNFNPSDLPLDDKDVEWSSSKPEIATIDQYGRVKGLTEGTTTIHCLALHGGVSASCLVHVVDPDSSYKTQWLLVDDPSTLAPGDLLTIACPEENVVAGLENTGMYLHPLQATFSKNEITSLPEGAGTYVLDGSKNNWTLESQEGKYLATTNEKKVTFVNSKGNIHWAFTMEEEGLYMESTSNVPGWMMYNAKTNRFTTYESNPQLDMFLVSLYRLTKTKIR